MVDENGARSTGYAELDALSGRVAAKLMKQGCRPGSAVMIELGRRMEYVAAYLGALEAGCVVVPVVPDYPRERLEHIRRDSEAACVLREDFFDDLNGYEPAAPVVLPEDAPAVMVYTSGSTGKPKGIRHSLRSLGDAVRRNGLMLEGVSPLRFGATAPMSFVAFVLEYLAVLSLGGCVHILDDATRRNVRRLEAYFDKHEISAAFISPQMLRLYRGSRGMARVIAASEVLRNVYSDAFEIYNVYGMSETLGTALCFPVDRAYDNTPIGKPVAGVEVFLLDETGAEVPDGTEGEICLKGCFVDGLLHTGDVGRRNESGDLVYVNRKDWMVKINGQRVETGEIEARLSACKGVTAAVRAFDDAMGQKYLVAYYTAESDADPAALTAALKKDLPDYMVPRYFRRLDRMPLNANGKIDRLALLPPDISDYKSAYAAPENERQAALCRSVEKLLDCGAVGIDDDFFRLGGDSIKVLALISDAGLDGLTPDMVLRGRTARDICALLDSAGAEERIAHQAALAEWYPLTEAQLGVYLQCVEEPQSKMYNIPMCCELPVGMDLPRFAEAVRRVLENHRALGVRIGKGPDGSPRMVPTDYAAQVPLKTVDSLEAEVAAFIRPFDIENEPLFRAEVVSCGDGDRFLFDMHHLVFDGSSVRVLLDDIAKAYNGKPLQEEALTLFDVSVYEETLKESPRYREAQAYFEKLLSGLDADSRPVSDIIDPAPEKGAGRVAVSLGDALTVDQAEHFARERGITEGTLFLGAFAYALAKFNGAEDARFCTVDSGRHDPRLEGAVGMFVKTLPFYLRMDEKESVSDYLKRTQDLLFEEMKHDCISFGELAQNYGVRPDISFVYQAELLNGALEARSLETGDTQFDLTVMVMKTRGNYELSVDYRTELYSAGMMNSFADMLAKVISEMTAARRLGDIALTSPSALTTLDGFNRTDAPYDAGVTVIDLFRQQAKRVPENTAVVYQDKAYTYGELDRVTDALAKRLRACGVEREKVVAVLIPRCEYIAIASLGVLKAGGAYLPLDPTYPPERLNLMVKDSGAMLLIATPELNGIITDDFTGQRIMVDEIPGMTDDGGALMDPRPEDLFIMLYTSGTTGVPKGVMLTHLNLNTFCAWHRKVYGMDDHARIAAYASYGFDACMHDLYPALTSGGAVYIIPEDMRLDLAAMRQYYGDSGITHAFMTTQVGRQFAQMGNPGSLRLLTTGGEKLTPFEPKDIRTANVYGPTECTIFSTFYELKRLERDVPIGRALDNMKLYVVDKSGKRLPVGAAGELWISGPQVGRGYLNRPEQTAAAFTANPFSEDPKYARVYHTGDIVRFMPDGNVQFIGRRDAQVKVRGFRIELTEVEGVLREFPGVTDATVQAFDAPVGGKFLAAYLVCEGTLDRDALRAFIGERKPPYMVPEAIMQIERIPLNQNQKVDRRALPRPERRVEDAVPPQNETQQALFDIVAEVLGYREFGVNTDLYEAGLTSIASLRLNVLLSEKFNVPVRSADLKENSTIEKLERFFRNAAPRETFEALPDYALTKTQEGIFVESIAKADSTIYNVPVLMEISDSIDLKKLRTAIVAAINAHPYIKTRLFMNEDGDVRQRRMDGDFSFDENQIETVRAKDLQSVMNTLIRPFKLLGGRLFRVKLIEADHRYVLIEMHHIISDGTSVNILLNDIDRAYRGEKLEPETFSGYEVVLNEQKLRQGENLEKAKAHYANLLEGVDADSLPVPDVRDFRPEGIGEASLVSDGVTVEDARHFCEVNRSGLNAFFTAVFGLTLARYNGTQQSAFAGIYNGRNDSRLSRTVSMLVKTLPIVADAADDRGVGEYVSAMNGQLLDSMASDVYSFAEISREYGAKADVMFIYQGDEMEPDRFCGEPARMMPIRLDTVKAPLCVFVYLKDGRVRWASEYNSGLYSAEFIGGLLEALDRAAQECLIREKLREVSILTDHARRAIEGFNDTDNPYDDTQSVVDPILAQFKKTPERTALVYEDRRYTYQDVDRLTGRLAQHLTREGIGPETVTAVLIPRCEYMLICSLGVLRAGGAYLPLDPSYPPERLNLMVKDSGARLLITAPELNDRITGDFTGHRILTTEIPEMEDLGIATTLPRPENLFVMLYTSGSTGTPKGVMLEHRNVFAFFTWYMRHTGFDEDTHVASYASYGFDACMQDLYPALMVGGCVYIIPEDMRLELNRLREYFCENKMTHAFMTTQIGRSFALMERVPSLKMLMMGGEKLVPFAPPDFLVMNGYGPSECAMGSSVYTITALEKDVPIGPPLDNLKIYVVDPRGHLQPPGATGELWIAGPQVSRGYLNRPEQTAKVFTKNPFCDDQKHARVYHTGDMARYLPDGNLQFIGRRDGMVKVRGFRIELTEVEEVVRRFPGIKDATVVAFDDNAGGKFLAAYLVSDDKLDTEAIKQFILAEKPPYMVPAVMMQIDRIPYTQNQKVNRRALPLPERKTSGREAANDTEKRLCEYFAEALGMEKIYVDDDFFDLGGTSISAAKIAMKCATNQIPVVYKDIFDYPTPHRLSEFVRTQQGQKPAEAQKQPESAPEGHEELWDVLKHNCPAEVDDIQYADIGNVLVTGATGFLGIHVVKQLIDSGAEKIYCLMRRGDSASVEQRLTTMLMYYFDYPYKELIGNRIVVIEGDILDSGLYDKLKDVPFDTMINCAASVKHFSSDDSSNRINFHGVENLIDLCLRLDKKLIQTSTISVAGTTSMDPPPVMREDMLSFGQKLENKYTHSKWLAERAVLTAVKEKGLRGKVIRLGNLMSREKDGEFQMNFETNGFMNHLRGFAELGCYRVAALDTKVEYSAIDNTADAILRLAGTPDQFTVFHANNCHTVHMANVLRAMAEQGIRISIVNDREFKNAFEIAMQDEERNMYVSSLITYNTHDLTQRPIEADNTFTVKALYRLGFYWPLVSEDYIQRSIEALNQLNFFG